MRDRLIQSSRRCTILFWLAMGLFILGMVGTIGLWMITLSWFGLLIAGGVSLFFVVATILKTNADNALRDYVKSRSGNDVSRLPMEDVIRKAEAMKE